MTDQELKDLVASLAINHQKMAEESARSRKEITEESARSRKEITEESARSRKEITEESAHSRKKMAEESALLHKKMAEESALLHKKIAEESALLRKEMAEESALLRKEMAEESARSRKEMDEAIKETNDALKSAIKGTDKALKELSKQIGGIANKFGSFTEGLALPSMTKILTKQFGMTTINPSVRVRDKNGNEQEIDVLAYANGTINTAFIVEVKSHLREEGIEQLLKQCRDFRVLFPELADKKLYGILAAVDASQQLQQKVLAQGLYFAKIHDEQFSLCVPKDFKPFCFNPG